jgi:hypothetical protein
MGTPEPNLSRDAVHAISPSRSRHCDRGQQIAEGQGYHFTWPIPAAEFSRLLQRDGEGTHLHDQIVFRGGAAEPEVVRRLISSSALGNPSMAASTKLHPALSSDACAVPYRPNSKPGVRQLRTKLQLVRGVSFATLKRVLDPRWLVGWGLTRPTDDGEGQVEGRMPQQVSTITGHLDPGDLSGSGLGAQPRFQPGAGASEAVSA